MAFCQDSVKNFLKESNAGRRYIYVHSNNLNFMKSFYETDGCPLVPSFLNINDKRQPFCCPVVIIK